VQPALGLTKLPARIVALAADRLFDYVKLSQPRWRLQDRAFAGPIGLFRPARDDRF
jgi:hypothetical protein